MLTCGFNRCQRIPDICIPRNTHYLTICYNEFEAQPAARMLQPGGQKAGSSTIAKCY